MGCDVKSSPDADALMLCRSTMSSSCRNLLVSHLPGFGIRSERGQTLQPKQRASDSTLSFQ